MDLCHDALLTFFRATGERNTAAGRLISRTRGGVGHLDRFAIKAAVTVDAASRGHKAQPVRDYRRAQVERSSRSGGKREGNSLKLNALRHLRARRTREGAGAADSTKTRNRQAAPNKLKLREGQTVDEIWPIEWVFESQRVAGTGNLDPITQNSRDSSNC